MGTFNKFRFWCQKVLPLVYDDSLSYYELLCKLVKHLEEAFGELDTMSNDIANLQALYVELKKMVDGYLSDEKLREQIDAKLDEMVEDGTFDEIVGDATLDFLRNKVDEYIESAGNTPNQFHGYRVFRQPFVASERTALQSVAFDGTHYYFGGNDLATATQQNPNVKGVIVKVKASDGSVEGVLETTNPNTLGHCAGMTYFDGKLYCVDAGITSNINIVNANEMTLERTIEQNVFWNIDGVSVGGVNNDTLYVCGWKQGMTNRMFIGRLDITNDTITEVSHFDMPTGGNHSRVRQSFLACGSLGYFITNEGNTIYVTSLENGGLIGAVDVGQGCGEYPYGELEDGFSYQGDVYLHSAVRMAGSTYKYWFAQVFKTNLASKINVSGDSRNAIGSQKTLYVDAEMPNTNPRGTADQPFNSIEECAIYIGWNATQSPRYVSKIEINDGSLIKGESFNLASGANVVLEGDGVNLVNSNLYNGRYAFFNVNVANTLYGSNVKLSLHNSSINLLQLTYSECYFTYYRFNGLRGWGSRFELYNPADDSWYSATANLTNSVVKGLPPINKVNFSHSIYPDAVEFNINGFVGALLSGDTAKEDLNFSFVHRDTDKNETVVFGRLTTAQLTSIANNQTVNTSVFATISHSNSVYPDFVWFNVEVTKTVFKIGAQRVIVSDGGGISAGITGGAYDLRFYW